MRSLSILSLVFAATMLMATLPQSSGQDKKPAKDPDTIPVCIKSIVGEPKERKNGVYIVTVAIDRKIPNRSGRIIFSDKKYAEIAEYIPPKGKRIDETDRLVLYLDKEMAPLAMRTPDDLRAKLPLPARVELRGKPLTAPK